MAKITDESFDPKEEDVLLKLTMPKRELRPSTVMKMRQQKEAETQKTAVQQAPQPLQQAVPPQEEPRSMPTTPQPSPEPYHPQMLEPPREQTVKPHTPFSNVDMTRIEDMTRRIMYRDPQKAKMGKG